MRRIEPAEIAEALQPTSKTGDRTAAIKSLSKSLRHADRFRATWDAVGGATGLAAAMAEFSVSDVRTTCRWLGRTASAPDARAERRPALGELVRLLHGPGAPDERPLRRFYQDIVPACELEVVEEWEAKGVEWSGFQKKALARGHRERYEERFLREIFARDGGKSFGEDRALVQGNLALCEKVLGRLLEDEDPRVSGDFMNEFAMPLLVRLLINKKKKNYEEATKEKFLDYVIRALQKNPSQITQQLDTRQSGLLQLIIQKWKMAPADGKERFRLRVVQLLELQPGGKRQLDLSAMFGIAQRTRKRLDPESKYELLRLAFRHLKGYGIDIEDDSEEGLARLRDLPVKGNLWQPWVFFEIEIERSRRLFERLAQAYPGGDFFSPATTKSVLSQPKGPDNSRIGDVEVLRALLTSKSKAGIDDTAWLVRARGIVEDRKKRAEQSREPAHRAFWAKSAMNLAIAAGDLETFGDTVLWARRFVKDPLTSWQLYSGDVLVAEEAKDLLCGVPKKNTPAAAAATPASVKAGVDLADRILVDLTETAIMAVQEPGFKRSRWENVLQLPRAVVDKRLANESVESFNEITKSADSEDQARDITEMLWKPTMEVLLEIEALLYSKTATALLDSRNSVEVQAVYVLRNLRGATPALLAELARFLMDGMRARLGQKRLNVQMGNIIEIVLRVANSDEPALACPFIRDLIMDGGENSSWHRQLINVGFLSNLPSKAAKEFLHTMAGAMRDKMREQNARPFVKGGENKGPKPAIKVTTIKMMAQVLHNNLFISALSTCDILTALLSEARHIDARITIVQSLMSTLEVPSCPPELRARVLDALERHVVPAAAQLSERRPYTEEDWADGLPEVGEETPLLKLLLDQAQNTKLNPDDKQRIAKLVVSALEGSAVTNARWMKLFLATNKLVEGEIELPRCPVNPAMLSSFFAGWTEYMPASLFGMLCEIALTNASPSVEIQRVTKAVKKNRDLVDSNAGKHWLKQFDNTGNNSFALGLGHAAFVLKRYEREIPSKLEGGGGITLQLVQDFVLAAARSFVLNGDFEMLDALFSKLRSVGADNWSAGWKNWQANSVPLMKDAIALIEDIRSGKAARTSSQLRVLPSTIRLRTAVLPMPYHRHPALDEDVDFFVAELSELIDAVASRRLYHADFAHVKSEVLKVIRSEDLALFALKLGRRGSLSQQPTLADYLRLELVGDLLLACKDPKDEHVVEGVRLFLREWAGVGEEELRGMGLAIEGRLRGQGKKAWISLGEQE
ncbi:hypothetical protein CkaCkLH20_07367 [Colletotrichum karsti]|uniref:Uncharacterized protein n=1 Tax=Colletotrichum karsti TaxID=1095194 RepID=A0A9P6LJD2_9PEZI|nr:uncharacterized protein CkaCkLH20_07367 [Colletotrichum karsti]KAF9875101.1 hypothetical protein CkaCkLH20_07367 [Colletotrichum karsti]